MNVLRIVLLLCLGLLITTSTALAGKCKPVSANVGAVVNYYGAADCPPSELGLRCLRLGAHKRNAEWRLVVLFLRLECRGSL